MLSIILPVFQVEQYLEQSVNCLLRQKIEDIEIILVDDGSRDKSGEICDRFANEHNNITVIHQKNGGVSSARNTGMKAAKGEYIAFMDPDDFVDNDYYVNMLRAIKENHCDIVFSKYKRFYENGQTENVDETDFEKLNTEHKNISLFFKNLNPNCDDVLMGFVWRSIFKKSIIDENNIKFSESIDFSEDLVFLLEYLSHAAACCTVQNYGYNYRVRSASATGVSYKKNLFENRKHCLKKFKKLINENNFLADSEKETLINRIAYTSAKEIIYNEMRFNKNGISKIKEYYKNDFEEIFLNNKTLIQLKKDKSDKITSLILHLAKCKVFLPIKLMYMFKYKKEREHLQK